MEDKTVIVHFDGSCTDTKKDGFMGTGIHAYYKGDKNLCSLFKISEYTGIGTHNESEYLSVIRALTELINRKLHTKKVIIYGDSQLIIKQLTNEYRTREFRMYELRNKAQELMEKFPDLSFKQIPRERNALADNLSKECVKGKRMFDPYKYRF